MKIMNITIEPVLYKIIAAAVLLGVTSGAITGFMVGFIYGAIVCGVVTLGTFYYTIYSVGENNCFTEDGVSNG